MEKLTAKDARKISLSKSTKVQEVVDDCLGGIRIQAEKGKFSCTLTAIYNESTVEVTNQLRELGYDVAYVYDNTSMNIIISW